MLTLAAGRQHRGGRRYSISLHIFLQSSIVNERGGSAQLEASCAVVSSAQQALMTAS
jgi:hypothetical protein